MGMGRICDYGAGLKDGVVLFLIGGRIRAGGRLGCWELDDPLWKEEIHL